MKLYPAVPGQVCNYRELSMNIHQNYINSFYILQLTFNLHKLISALKQVKLLLWVQNSKSPQRGRPKSSFSPYLPRPAVCEPLRFWIIDSSFGWDAGVYSCCPLWEPNGIISGSAECAWGEVRVHQMAVQTAHDSKTIWRGRVNASLLWRFCPNHPVKSF